jgi:high-affinity nickel-transport protein
MAANAITLAYLSAAVLGFRHGFDYDHIAAITDITSVEPSRPRAMRMGLVYALGHAATVATLGSAVILFQRSIPKGLDSFAERAVGLTLVVLGVYVLGTMLRDKEGYVPRSRAAIMIDSGRWLARMAQRLRGREVETASRRDDAPYSARSVFLVGVIHGLGAETPSQLMLFMLAANLGGAVQGLLGLAVFLGGLLVMNLLMTASAVGLFGLSAAKPGVLRFVIGATAAYSVVVGTVFLFGVSSLLPQLG